MEDVVLTQAMGHPVETFFKRKDAEVKSDREVVLPLLFGRWSVDTSIQTPHANRSNPETRYLQIFTRNC